MMRLLEQQVFIIGVAIQGFGGGCGEVVCFGGFLQSIYPYLLAYLLAGSVHLSIPSNHSLY